MAVAAGALGIDTSSWQGTPNWAQVAGSGRTFAYIKAGEGSSTSYPTLDEQYVAAKAAKMVVGLYHYAKPAQTPEANADALAAQVNRLGAVDGHLPPCLDLEEGTGDLSTWAQAFIARLRAQTGCTQVMVYSGASFFQTHIGEGWMDPDIVLWIAHYGRAPGSPAYLTPRVALHQYASDGSIPGVAGNVDLNYAIWPLDRLVNGGDEMAQIPQQQWDDLYQQICGEFDAWGGGITDDQNTQYRLLQFILRNNVEIHQMSLAFQSMAEQIEALTTAFAQLKSAMGGGNSP